MQRLADQLVRDVGPVVLGRVDVVDAELDRAPQHGNSLVVVARRPHDAGAGKLHGAEADAVHGEGTEGVCVHAVNVSAWSTARPTRTRKRTTNL